MELQRQSAQERITYLELKPSPVLRPLVRSIWYCRAPNVTHTHERVLPNGCAQIIVNLVPRNLTDCSGHAAATLAPAIIVGAHARYHVIDTTDLTELAGFIVEPGGFAALFSDRADLFFEKSIALDDVWPGFEPTERMSEAQTPLEKLKVLETLLRKQIGDQICRSRLVNGAIRFLSAPHANVSACARYADLSERRFSQRFREEVGLSPKLWLRTQRFQAAIKALHQGTEIRWAELALQCGYYDQPHFINDFHAFSGINPTTYSALRGRWRNHVPLE